MGVGSGVAGEATSEVVDIPSKVVVVVIIIIIAPVVVAP